MSFGIISKVEFIGLDRNGEYISSQVYQRKRIGRDAKISSKFFDKILDKIVE